MRDLHDDISRSMMLDLTGEDRPVPQLGKVVCETENAVTRRFHVPYGCEGASEGKAMQQLHAGDGLGRATVLPLDDVEPIQCRPECCITSGLDGDMSWLEHEGVSTCDAVAGIMDAAVAFFAASGAGPLPLMSSEPWAESDGAYSERLGWADAAAVDRVRQTFGGAIAPVLDWTGKELGLPRARLVPADPAKEP